MIGQKNIAQKLIAYLYLEAIGTYYLGYYLNLCLKDIKSIYLFTQNNLYHVKEIINLIKNSLKREKLLANLKNLEIGSEENRVSDMINAS